MHLRSATPKPFGTIFLDPAMNDIVFRAFQLARDGCYGNIRHLEMALSKEGYEQAQLHLSGALIRKQLYAIIKNKS